MANVFEYKKDSLDDITLEYMKDMACMVMSSGITEFGVVGCAGDTYYLYGDNRKAEVSFRNWCSQLEFLITDLNGKFIVYNKLDGLSFNDLIEEYYRQFLAVKHLIETEIHHTFGDDWFTGEVAEGFRSRWKGLIGKSNQEGSDV